jgi:hypothetical protein
VKLALAAVLALAGAAWAAYLYSQRHSGDLCRCGHSRASHEHHRLGLDCVVCGCERYRRA